MTQSASSAVAGGENLFGRFELLQPITSQRHARVLLARRQGSSGAYSFLKLAHDDERLDHSNAMLEREFECLERLDDSLFIRPTEIRRVDAVRAIEFPFEEGISLSEILGALLKQQGGMPKVLGDAAPAVSLVCRLLDGMSAAADGASRFSCMTLATSGADHLLITRDGRLRAIGFADVVDTDVERVSEVWSPFTAPELFVEGRRADLRADIYAAGVLLFQLLTLRPPISLREPTMHLVYRLYRNLHPSVSDVVPELSGFDPVVARAMRWLPDDRYPDPASLNSALLAVCPEARETGPAEFSSLFRLALELRNRRRPAAENRRRDVGMKVSAID